MPVAYERRVDVQEDQDSSYEVAHPSPTASVPRKKVRLLRLIGERWTEVRQPETGLVSMVTREKLIGPIEPVIVNPENCAQCGGKRKVAVIQVVEGGTLAIVAGRCRRVPELLGHPDGLDQRHYPTSKGSPVARS